MTIEDKSILSDPVFWIAWLRDPSKHVGMADRGYVAYLWENERTNLLLELRNSYLATPVDCLISELRDEFYLGGLTRQRFEERVAQFKAEIE